MDKLRVYKELADFIKIESVSTDPKRFAQIIHAVDFLTKKLRELGFKINLIQKDKIPPLLIASKIISKSFNTLGIYGHYDVQPEDPIKEWETAPFELQIKNNKLYGRGVADNKGHIIQNITAIEKLIKTNNLKNNILFILEGEEETGSSHFEEFIQEAKESLAMVNVFYITDMGMYQKNVPQFFYGLRGLVYFEIKAKVGEHDLHSGVYGNRVLNPVQVLCNLFAKIKDVKSGRILLPNFYKDVRKVESQELQLLEKIKRSDQEEQKEGQIYRAVNCDQEYPYLSAKIYPSFDLHGFLSGFVDDGSKTVIPAEASAKFSFRLVEYQNPDKIEELVKRFIQNNLPEGVKYELITHAKSAPFYTSLDNFIVKKAASYLQEVFGHETLFNRSGGSVAAAEILSRVFNKPIILTGFTLPDDNIHAPNENFDQEMFWKGIEAMEKIYSQ